MLKPEQMSRLLIVATRDQMGPVIAELYRHNLFHIEDYVEAAAKVTRVLRSARLLQEQVKHPADLVKIRAIQNAFSIRSEDFEVKQRHNTVRTSGPD